MTNQPLRLNKFLAEKLGYSRREADDLIAAGKVLVNGQPAVLGQRFSAGDKISLNGKLIDARPQKFTYLALNKPVGYVCSRKSQDDSPTVYSLLPPRYQNLKTVGRLDKNSSGLILLTNDGDFAHKMTHPKFQKTKIYEVKLDKNLQPLHRQMISDNGVSLSDGVSQFELERLNQGNDQNWRVIMHEGRNRQIRRTFAALGYDVKALHRVQFGNYKLEKLPVSNYKEIAK